MSKIHVQNPNTAEDFVAAKYDRFRRKAKNFAAYVRWWIHEYIMYQMYSSSFDSGSSSKRWKYPAAKWDLFSNTVIFWGKELNKRYFAHIVTLLCA